MNNYVTLFDSCFLPQGLALHTSMIRCLKTFILWIICVDEECFYILKSLNLENVRLINLKNIETKQLREIKKTRTRGEYCWTLTPFTPTFVFDSDKEVDLVIYIDADIWFRNDPYPILDEFLSSGKSVLITEHGYSPECDESNKYGIYCVQFMAFKRKESAEVIHWWQQRCLEWCFAREEDGKFGDQKYLDNWPKIFSSEVHVLSKNELALAPWNCTRFPYYSSIFYHFHGVRLNSKNTIIINEYAIPKSTFKHVYLPYFNDIRFSFKLLSETNYSFVRQTNNLNIGHKARIFIFSLYQILKPLFKKNEFLI